MQYHLKILPLGKKILCEQGEVILDVLKEHNIPIQSICGGKGSCGKCKIKIMGSLLPAPDEYEIRLLTKDEIENGVRLACRTKISFNLRIDVLAIEDSRGAKILTFTKGEEFDLPFSTKKIISLIIKETVTPLEGTFENPLSDTERITSAIKNTTKTKIGFSHFALKALPFILRKSPESKISVLRFKDKILGVESEDDSLTKKSDFLGVAVDIGTTTIAVELIDLRTGDSLGIEARLNPQRVFGEDVITRIQYIADNGKEGLFELQRKVVEEIQECVESLIRKKNLTLEDVVAICSAGNATMIHILLGITPQYLGLAPYLPVFNQAAPLPARNIGFSIHPEGLLFTLPNLGGFLGGDTVADLLTFNVFKKDNITLMIDIGTNGEIVLSNGSIALATTTAAGPAFEGARISMGMRGESGAIEHFRIKEDGQVELEIISGASARGICGSGLIEIVAELLDVGLIDQMGRFKNPEQLPDSLKMKTLKSRLIKKDNQMAFLVAGEQEGAVHPIFLNHQDLRELQLAKGAIAAGIEILLKQMKIRTEEIDRVYLAGAFGNYISKTSALRIRLIPSEIQESKIISLGNAALNGARLFLLYEGARKFALTTIPQKVKFFELAGNPEFQDAFANHLRFLY